MTETVRIYLAVLTAVLAAIGCALLAGNVSQALANLSVQSGGPSFLREPINAAIALALVWGWRKWRPAGNYSPPKWGHIGIGLVLGLAVGIGLPALALLGLQTTGLAKLTLPEFDGTALFVPLVFLLIHGFAEEVLVRAVAQREGHTYLGPWGGVGLAALAFAGLQALQGYGGPIEIINSALFGAVLGFLALGAGGIWSAVCAHAGWTWLEVTALGGADQIVKTSHWLSGSGRDSYGSLMFTMVLIVVLCAQIALQLRRQKSII